MERRTTPVDHAIGARVKERRRQLGMSQTELGEKIGVTFQQVQKYELGTNRIGAGRLASIAGALDVPITFLLDQPGSGDGLPGEEDAIALALRDPETVELVRAFSAVKGPALKRHVVEFVRALSGSEAKGRTVIPPTGARN